MRRLSVFLCLAAAAAAALAQVTIEWREGPPLPLGAFRAASGLIDGRIYIFGGPAAPSLVHWAYDISGDSWVTDLAPMPSPSSFLRGVVHDGELYVLGGYLPHNAALRKYNPVQDSWYVLSSPPCRTTAYGHGVSAVGDRIYFYYGRWNDTAYTNEFWEYDPSQDTWTELARACGDPRCFVGSASDGACCYSVGGFSGGARTDFCRFDAAADSWETLPEYPLPVYSPDGDFLQGRLFVAGGGCSFKGIPEQNQVFYWTEGDGWDSTDFLPDPVGNPLVELTTHNDTDYVFVMGGTRDRVLLNTMYVGVITGLRTAGVEGPAVSARERTPATTHVNGILRLPDGAGAVLLDASGRQALVLTPGANDIRHLAPGVYFQRPVACGDVRSGGAATQAAARKVIVTR